MDATENSKHIYNQRIRDKLADRRVVSHISKGINTKLLVFHRKSYSIHSKLQCAKKPVTTMLTYPWKCTVLHCNHLGNTWKPLVLMTRHFDYFPSASEGDNQSVRSSAPVVSRCFPGGYNVKLYISRGMVSMVVTGFFAQC